MRTSSPAASSAWLPGAIRTGSSSGSATRRSQQSQFPYSSGHLMVAPRRHVGEFAELTDAEVVEVHRLVGQAMGALAATYAPQGYNVGWNLGRIAARGLRTTSRARFRAGPATRTSCRSRPT